VCDKKKTLTKIEQKTQKLFFSFSILLLFFFHKEPLRQ
jgi:hypothetical protein